MGAPGLGSHPWPSTAAPTPSHPHELTAENHNQANPGLLFQKSRW